MVEKGSRLSPLQNSEDIWMEILRKIALTFALLMSVAAAQSYPIITAGGGIQEWQTATNYVTDDIVWENEDFYKALTVHTSGVFAIDYANAEWIRMSDDLDKIGASNDNAIVRWDGVLGEAVQNSGIIVDDLDNIHSVNSLTVGGVSPSASSSLDVFSTTQGTRPWPSMTTAQRDAITAPATSLAIYNTDTDKVNVFNGTIWKAVGSGIDAWQASFDYVVGDVVYNGTDAAREIYVANGTFTSGGAFVPGNWTELAQHVNRLPFGTAVATALVKWADTDGDNILTTGITVDASNNIAGAGDISLSDDIEYRDSPLSIHSDDLDGADLGIATLAGGGTSGSDRGGSLSVLGNDQASGGSVQVVLGDVATAGFSVSDSSGDLALNVDTLGVGSLPLLTASKPLQLNASNEIISADINASTDITGTLPIANGGTGNTSFTGDRVIVSDAAGTSLTASSNLLYDGNLFEVTTPEGSIPMTKMNQASRLALTPVNGITVYDTDDEKPYYYDGANWKPIGSLAVSSANLAVADYSELQIPLDQITVTDTTAGLEKVRIETGNDSFLSNGSFEHETYSTGWTTSGSATYALETTDVWEGSKSVSVSATGGTQSFELIQSNTKTQYEGNTLGFTCMVKSDSAKVKLCTENGADEKDCVYHDGNGMWKKMQAIMMVDSTGAMVGSVKNDTNEDASVVVDSCEWSNDPLKIKSAIKSQNITAYGPSSSIIGQNNAPEFSFVLSQVDMDNEECFTASLVGLATEFKAVKSCDVKISFSVVLLNAGNVSYIYKNGSTVASGQHASGGNTVSQAEWKGEVSSGDIITLGGSTTAGTGADTFSLSINAQAVSEEILTASDIVSSETMAFQYKSTAISENDPVGTYTYHSMAAFSNAPVICGTDTQTIKPNNLDGLRVRSLGTDTASNCTSNITHYELQIGKGLRGLKTFWYVSANKVTELNVVEAMVSRSATIREGISVTYNEKTGILYIDGKIDTIGGSNDRILGTETDSGTVSRVGFIHFHASKNPVVNAMETIPIVDYSWENEFSAKFATTTYAVSDENQDWLNGNCSWTGSQISCPVNAGHFSQVPNCLVDANQGASSQTIMKFDSTNSTTTTLLFTSILSTTGANSSGVGGTIQCSRASSDYKERGSTAAIIAQPTCYIKDVKASGTNGGTCTAGTWAQTRDLNVLEGKCDDITLSANEFTLSAGTWKLEGHAPAFGVNTHRAKIYDTDNLIDVVLGSTAEATAGSPNSGSSSYIDGEINILTDTTFDLRHRCDITQAGNGFGPGAGFGELETFSVIKATRIK